MEEEKTAEIPLAARLSVNQGPPPKLGEAVLDREIPSDPALVPPLVLRVMEFLSKESLVLPKDECKIGLCLEEALQNAVLHGNRKDFKKKVKLSIFMSDEEWGIIISDEGKGFDPAMVRDPLQGESLWGESGRGLYLMSHYMDRLEYFNGGSTVVMARKL
jgi:serine/threonine-protein kinase RsbW